MLVLLEEKEMENNDTIAIIKLADKMGLHSETARHELIRETKQDLVAVSDYYSIDSATAGYFAATKNNTDYIL